MLAHSAAPHSQAVEESWAEMDGGGVAAAVARGGHRGDFLLTIGRNTAGDARLAETLARHLRGYSTHHLQVTQTYNF